MVEILHKTGGGKGIGLVEDFISDTPALRQALACQFHAHAQGLVFWHHNSAAIIADFIFDAALLKLFGDGG